MKKAKKPIALLLVLILFVSLLPAGALAADDAEPAEEAVEILPPEEEAELPDVEEETPPPEEEEEALPEEPDDPDPVAVPEEEVLLPEDGEEVEIQADDPEVFEDEATGLRYTVADGKATITGVNSSKLPAELVIPATLGGVPVTAVGESAFHDTDVWNRYESRT